MYRSSTMLLALGFLTGCPDEPITISPVPAPSPTLSSGEYALRVDSVNRWSCEGIRQVDVVGSEMELELAIKGGRADGDLNGLPVSGVSEPGFVYLDGSVQPMPMEDEDVSEPDDDEVEDEVDHGDTGEQGNEADEKCMTEDEPPTHTDTDGRRSDVSLDLAALNPHSGTGVMIVEIPGCSADVNVSVTWLGPLGSKVRVESQPVEPNDPEEGEGSGQGEEQEEDPCLREGEDCG